MEEGGGGGGFCGGREERREGGTSVANSCAMFTKGLTRCLNRFKDSMITIVSSMK